MTARRLFSWRFLAEVIVAPVGVVVWMCVIADAKRKGWL